MFGRVEKEQEVTEAGEFVEAEGVRLHYLTGGVGRPVVLLHGNAGFAQDFAAVLEALDPEEFRAFSFDRPGHGLSQTPADGSATMDAQAGILRSALYALGVQRPVVVGHSWGGALALSYALQFPEEVA